MRDPTKDRCSHHHCQYDPIKTLVGIILGLFIHVVSNLQPFTRSWDNYCHDCNYEPSGSPHCQNVVMVILLFEGLRYVYRDCESHKIVADTEEHYRLNDPFFIQFIFFLFFYRLQACPLGDEPIYNQADEAKDDIVIDFDLVLVGELVV